MQIRRMLLCGLLVILPACKGRADETPPATADSPSQQAAPAPQTEEPSGGAIEPAGETNLTEVPPVGSEEPGDILATIEGEGQIHMTMVTSMGEIHCRLYDDLVPNTVANFVGLATGYKSFIDPETGETVRRRFFDGLIFHRVIPDFMIQGGDPLGRGTGGPGYRFNDEFDSTLRHDRPGTLSMANAGPNTNGSQFFITERPTSHLDGRHSVFGHCEDLDVIRRIARVPTGPRDKPLDDVLIETIQFERR